MKAAFKQGVTTVQPDDAIFVLEQSLGHVTHGANIERAVASRNDISARFIRVDERAVAEGRKRAVVKNYTARVSWAARRAVQEELKRRPARAVFVHTQIGALLLSDVMRQVPTVVSMDATPVNFDTLSDGYGHSVQPAVVERAKLAINQRAFMRAAALVTWSRWASDSLVRDYQADRNIHVISPGVDLTRFHPGAPVRRTGRPRLLFVGGDFRRKGGADLLEVMRRLGDRAELDVVTTSNVKPISSNIRVHHGLTHASPKLLDLYRNADIFVMPARGECFGQVIPEAMACALPVVGCRVGATPELVIHGYNGLLVTPSDATGLFDALLRLVQDPYERRKMGQRSLHMARRDHDVDRNVGRLLEVIERVARRRGTAPRCQPISADEARDRVGVGVYSERTP